MVTPSIYMPSFNQFLLAVYPIGMTDLVIVIIIFNRGVYSVKLIPCKNSPAVKKGEAKNA